MKISNLKDIIEQDTRVLSCFLPDAGCISREKPEIINEVLLKLKPHKHYSKYQIGCLCFNDGILECYISNDCEWITIDYVDEVYLIPDYPYKQWNIYDAKNTPQRDDRHYLVVTAQGYIYETLLPKLDNEILKNVFVEDDDGNLISESYERIIAYPFIDKWRDSEIGDYNMLVTEEIYLYTSLSK